MCLKISEGCIKISDELCSGRNKIECPSNNLHPNSPPTTIVQEDLTAQLLSLNPNSADG